MDAMKSMLDKVLKTSLVIMVLPALVFYATSFRNSLSFFTNNTQSAPFNIIAEQPMLLFSLMDVEAEVVLEIIGDDEIEVSNDYMETQYSIILTDNGEEVTDAWVFWSLAEDVHGVTIDDETGILTVQSNADAGVVMIQADVVGMTAFKSVIIAHPPVIITVPNSIYGNFPESVPESVYGEI